MKKTNFLTNFFFLFGQIESQTLKQLKKNIAIFMENQDFQQSLIETNARALNITKIQLFKNRYIINGLVDACKNINNMVYLSNLLIKRLNYAQN